MAGIDAFGTQWGIESTPGSGIFTAVAELTNIDVLDVDVDTQDVSSHDSTGQWREFVAGMKDGGELSMEVNFDPTLHATLYAEVGGTAKGHQITLPEGTEVTFDALVTGASSAAPFDDKLAATFTVKVTGPVTITTS